MEWNRFWKGVAVETGMFTLLVMVLSIFGMIPEWNLSMAGDASVLSLAVSFMAAALSLTEEELGTCGRR